MRKNIYDIIKSSKIDIKKEYVRIYDLFYNERFKIGPYSHATIEYVVNTNFSLLNKNLIGRCRSLEDFNDSYKYHFARMPRKINIDLLLKISEYVVNFVHALMGLGNIKGITNLFIIEQHINSCMEDIGYKKIIKENIIIYVENDPGAISVAETIEGELSYSILEYNHYKMKGDLSAKKSILKNMADNIENDRKIFNSINKEFTSDLFQMLNKFIRHNTDDNSYISGLTKEELEKIYDEIYQMWLFAKLSLEQKERNKIISKIIEEINK